MDLILLAGNSQNNKDWIEEVEQSLRPYFGRTVLQYYKHWLSGQNLIDLEGELKELVKITENLQDYTIFAKSAGVVLAIKGIFEKAIRPQKCVFIGTPVLWSKEKNFSLDKWIENFATPSLFIQQQHDPAMPADDLKKYLREHKVTNYKFIIMPGESHHYADLERLKKLVLEFKSLV